jgi:hypothetical protein
MFSSGSSRFPDQPLDVGRRHGKSLVGAPRGHAEVLWRSSLQIRQQRLDKDFQIRHRASGDGEVGDAEHVPQPVSRALPGRTGAEHHLDATHDRPHLAHVEIRQRELHVIHQAADEPRTVLSLEGDLLIVDDNRTHEACLTGSCRM